MASPVPSIPGVAIATVPSTSPSGSPSPTPAPTAAPATVAPTPSFPIVDSCDPSSVPSAKPVAGTGSGKASTFALHVPIIEYHRIVPTAEAGNSLPGLVASPTAFSAQLDALKAAGWHTITMATLANDLDAHKTPPARTFVITLDDGWDDGYTYALPILERHGFVATFFVIGSRIDRQGFLTSDHLQALVAAGDEIGDHTMDHVSLSQKSGATLTYEIDAAAARIAQVTGYWPESLAYPYGGVNARAEAGVAACQGLRIAVIEEPTAPEKPAASQSPAASRAPGSTAKPTARAPLVSVPTALETWTNRWAVPRVRVWTTTVPARLVAELALLERA